MKIAYTLDLDDILTANLIWLDLTSAYGRLPSGLRSVVVISLAAIGLVEWASGSAVWFIWPLLIPVGLIVFSKTTIRKLTARNLRAQLARHPKKGVVGRHELEIAPSALIERTEHSETSIGWDGIARTLATDDCLLIGLSGASLCYIPREKVCEGDFDAFVSAVGEHIPVAREIKASSSYSDAVGATATTLRYHRYRRVAFSAVVGAAVGIVGAGLAGAILAGTRQTINWSAGSMIVLLTAAVLLPAILVAAWIASAREEHSEETQCRACRHILRGLTAPRCPECGEPI